MKIFRKAFLFLLILLVTFPARVPTAETSSPAPESSPATDLGLGAGSALATLFYTPAKVLYAGFGLLTGGAAYVVTGGNSTVANRILTPSLRGTYVITPRHLTGEERVEFVGRAPASAQD
jgi:hypothetical protein